MGDGAQLDEKELQKLNYEAYLRHVDRLQSARQSSFEQYDKAILSLSSAGLGLSLGFAQTVLHDRSLTGTWLLFFSWGLFILAIISTILSFRLATKAIDPEIENAAKYYIDGDKSALSQRHCLTHFVEVVNVGSGVLFVSAIVFTAIFFALNLKPGGI